LVIIPFLFAIIAYWMIHLSASAGQFFLFYLITFLVSLSGNSFGLLVGSLFSDSKVASGLLPLIVLPLVLFSGFYKNRGDLPAWIGWL
jgi:ABC-type multidrug transport system permease subunit